MLNQNMVIVIWLNYVVSYAEEQGHLCVFVTSKREVTEAPCRRVTFITSCEIIDTSSAPKTWEKRMPAFTLSPLQVRQIKSGMWIDSETSNSKRRHCNYLNRCVRAKSIHFKGQIQSVKSSSLRIICRGCAEHVSKWWKNPGDHAQPTPSICALKTLRISFSSRIPATPVTLTQLMELSKTSSFKRVEKCCAIV